MAELLLFNQSYAPYVAGNTYLISDDNATNFMFLGIATIVSEPVTITNATIQVDMSSVNQTLSGGTQSTKLVDNLGNVLSPSGTPSKLSNSFIRPNDTTNYTINDSINTSLTVSTTIILSGASISNGGGGIINDVIIETDALQFAGSTIRIWLYDSIPTNIINDNSPFVINNVNKNKRLGSGYFDIIFDSLLAGSDTIIGRSQPLYEYNCAVGDNKIYFLFQTLSTITTPKANGNFNIIMNVLKLS